MPKRIVVEASEAEKSLLDNYLESHGTSLAEWFGTHVAEATADYASMRNGRAKDAVPGYSKPSRRVIAELRALDWGFYEADTGYLTHGLHPYPAKFIPQIPRALIECLSSPGDLVWDPFAGSGTTAVEAALLGRRSICSDVNPLSEIIGRAKTTILSRAGETTLRRLATNLELLGRDAASFDELERTHSEILASLVPVIPNFEKWFAPIAIRELAMIRWHLGRLEAGGVSAIAQCALSRILVRVSFQDGETRYASKPRKVDRGAVLRTFAAELNSQVSRAKALAAAIDHCQARFLTADLRSTSVVPPNSVDLIVTSPPYPNATDYHLYHRFRLLWLGFSPQEFAKKEIGSHLRHQKESTGIEEYVLEMRSCLEHLYEGLRPGCFAALVVGDGVFDGTTYSTRQLLGKCAKEAGFENAGSVERGVHNTRRSFISPARRLRREEILLVRKPARRSAFLIRKPAYRLWPYEDGLRLEEIKTVTGARVVRDRPEGALVRLDSVLARSLKKLTFSQSFESDDFSHERTWQAVLENGDTADPKTRKDPKYAGHGIHEYKGKFYPQLSKALFNLAQLKVGSRVVDPFCGSGTVPLEARLNGYDAYGVDLNPLAVNIASAKSALLDVSPRVVADLADAVLSVREQYPVGVELSDVFDVECIAELNSWFPERVLRKLAALRMAIEQTPHSAARALFMICLSAIVRGVSHQDPKDLRIRRRKSPLIDGPVYDLFASRVSETLTRHRQLSQVKAFMPWQLGQARIVHGDTRKWEVFDRLGVGPASIDAIVTSPPYATALPYIDTDRLSLLVLLGMRRRERNETECALMGSREITKRERAKIEELIDARSFDRIPSRTARTLVCSVLDLNRRGNVGFRRKNQAALLYRYYQDMAETFVVIDRVAKKQAQLFFVIGDNKTIAGGKEVVIKSGAALREIGESLGWKLQRVIPITVTKEARPNHRHSITENEIIWFQKA